MESHGAVVNTTGRGIEPLMTLVAVANVLGVSRQTVYRLISAGELIPIRVGSSPRFRPADVEAYLDRHREAVP